MPAHWSPGDAPGSGGTPAEPNPAPPAAEAGASADGSSAEKLLRLYRRLTQSMTRPAEQSRLLLTVAEEAARLLRASGAGFFAADARDPSIVVTRVGVGTLAEREGELLPAEGSFEGRALRTGKPQHASDLSQDARGYRVAQRGLEVGPALALPLAAEGRPSAALLIVRAPGSPDFTPAELEMAAAAVDAFAAALQSARVFDRARDSRAGIESWRREQQLLGWFAAHQAAARAEGAVVFRLDVAAARFEWGDAVAAIFGYSPAEFGTTLAEWSERVYADDRDRVREELERARRTGEAASVQFRLFHQNGVYRYATLRLLAAEDPQAEHRVGVLQDITERERLAAQRDQRARASAASEIIRALRHEINNPLSVVIGQIQLMQKDPAVAGSPALQQSLRALHEESLRMHDLLRRLASVEQHPREPFVTRSGGVNLPGEG